MKSKKLTKKLLKDTYKTVYDILMRGKMDPILCVDNPIVCHFIMALYYWKMVPVDTKLLKACLETEDYDFDSVFSYVADMWEKKAIKEMNQEMKKIEKLKI